ncbi:hypothetical protein LN736_16855 [Clostridium sp. WLY-B-L2]|jgi:magnesium-transporting ATPase (P-type)|uniref:Glycerophosphoryl diester phosphodiesterase membrane domain-containing protein n=1 Tax=Clostridium aromativorans TaxID=2836848 RepID=A0ABS8N9N7_9CLOT|nr:hypothetical protein [Clostridium aromativorans]MCC9296516.1 hypothetical protein [Clostridium aromativorans]
MFEAYKKFVMNTTQNLFHPELTSFTEYIQVVLCSMLVIISFLLIVAAVIAIIALPIVFYKKIIKKVDIQIRKANDDKVLISKLRRKKTIFIILFILALLVIYVPILLPLIIIVIDVLWASAVMRVILSIIGIILAGIALTVFFIVLENL